MKNKFIFAALLVLSSLAPLFADELFPGEKSDFHGCALYSVQIGGETAQVLVPAKPAAGRPWVLASQLYNPDSAAVGNMTRTELELVKRGFTSSHWGLATPSARRMPLPSMTLFTAT